MAPHADFCQPVHQMLSQICSSKIMAAQMVGTSQPACMSCIVMSVCVSTGNQNCQILRWLVMHITQSTHASSMACRLHRNHQKADLPSAACVHEDTAVQFALGGMCILAMTARALEPPAGNSEPAQGCLLLSENDQFAAISLLQLFYPAVL